MGWSEELADGHAELLSDGAGTIIERRGKSIPAIQGNGESLEQLVSGGAVDSENPSYSVLKTALAAAKWKPKQGDIFTVAGKRLKIASVSFDPADPVTRIFTRGEEQ